VAISSVGLSDKQMHRLGFSLFNNMLFNLQWRSEWGRQKWGDNGKYWSDKEDIGISRLLGATKIAVRPG